jgi:nitroreductase
MRLQSILLSLPFAVAPALSSAAAPAPSKVTSAYAVLKSAPPAPAPGCKTTRTDGGEIRASLYSDDTAGCPVARVADEPVPLGELADALAAAHMAKDSKARKGTRPQGMDFATPLDRIIDVRLIVQEAREMGLTEQPDYKQAMEAFRASTLRTMLQEQAAAGVKPDKAEVDRLYKAAVKEWKVRSVMFDQEADAQKFREAVAQGGSFDKLAKAAVTEKKAKGGEPGYVSVQKMLPELAHAADALKRGEVSQPVKVSNGWVVLKLEGIRYPEIKTARADANAQSLAEQQHKAVRRFHESLVKKYAKVDEKLMQSIDFEASGEAGFKALEKDPRVLAQIDGEKPVTVAELAGEVSQKFFHGIADPIKEKRVNSTKVDTFERILGSRLFAREARERKLDQDPSFRRKVEEYDRVLAFSSFIEVVLVPGVKVTEPEVQALYEKRKDQFTFPQMYRIDAMAFDNAKAAQATMDKLKAGTDLEWLRANAEGQLKPDDQALQFQGTPLSVKGMPVSLAKTLTGAQPGDYRLYATDDGKQHYVLRVAGQIPPSVKPYADVREDLAREVEAEKIGAAVKDYAAKLRKAQKVDVIVVRIAS